MKKQADPLVSAESYYESGKQRMNRWAEIATNGCNDPGYTDGCNMNLIRRQIMACKEKIVSLREECGILFFKENELIIPPYVSETFFRFPDSERAKRIRSNPNWAGYEWEEPAPQHEIDKYVNLITSKKEG